MKKFYIMNGHNQEGPFDIEQLKLLNINKNTPIWFDGIENWTTAEKVEDLKSILPLTVVPPIFVNPTQNHFSSTPPNFNNSSNIGNQNYNYKNDNPKSNLKRNSIIIGLILIGLLIFGLLIIGFITNNSQTNSNHSEPNYNIDQNENAVISVEETERKRINALITKKNMNYRNNWQKYLTVTTNQYQYSELGGIFNLAVVFTNNTEYVMDEIKVDVNYIKDNGGVYKTESVMFYNVLPGTRQSEQAPDSDRGTSVQLDVSQAYSKKMHFYYPNFSGNNEDPYFYKQ